MNMIISNAQICNNGVLSNVNVVKVHWNNIEDSET